MDTSIKFKTVEEYFATLPGSVKSVLMEVRKAVIAAAPMAKEVISYNMPAIKWHGVLVYYAAHKDHIGFYPTSQPIEVFKDELAPYKFSKGAIQFPIDKPIDLDLISRMVKFRVQRDGEKAGKK